MLYRAMQVDGQVRSYMDAVMPLLVESVVLGVLVNLVSGYIGDRLAMDGTTLFIILFLLLATLLVYALYRSQLRGGDLAPSRPTEFGSLLSLVFYAQLSLFDCAEVSGFNRWVLLGAGAIPFFLGLGISNVLDAKWHKYQQWKKEQEKEREQAERKPEPPVAASAGRFEREERTSTTRISVRSMLDALADVERQPGIIIVIIEAILSVQRSVTQMEIFEACRRLSKQLPSVGLIELIRDLMGSFVNVRQGTRKVLLKTEERDEWRIVEESSGWPKDDSWM